MYYFVQYRPDKKCSWELKDESKESSKTPAFQTVLKLSADPSSYESEGIDPDDKVKYLGPMYFDLDGKNLDEVLADSRELIRQLNEEHQIPLEALSVYLSGKKGVHITIPSALFGVNKALLHLPKIWEKFARKFEYESIDRVVYSMGKGRMWRCTNMQRPKTKTYKVQVSVDELQSIDSERYKELVAAPRPVHHDAGDWVEIPGLSSFVKAAMVSVKRDLTEYKKYLNSISSEELRSVGGIPGCIEKLVTEGDCPASNWNQAAMQLAGYIAARYDTDEETEYREQLIDPFLDNVTSSSRPNRSDRASAFKYQLKRAFSGSTKFSAGGIIKTIGRPCGHCVVCSRKQTLTKSGKGDEYDKETGIKMTGDGIYLVGEQSMKKIVSSRIVQTEVYRIIEEQFGQERDVAGKYELSGGTVSGKSVVEITEKDMIDKRAFSYSVAGFSCVWEGGDSDLNRLYKWFIKKRSGVKAVIRTYMSGIQFREKNGDLYPNLVTRNDSYRKGGTPSEFVYCGRTDLAPDFSSVRDFESSEDVKGLVTELRNLLGMNDKYVMLSCTGWIMATHLKSHLTYKDRSFPMLNLYGASQNGKSATAFLLAAMNGFPYRSPVTWNLEVDSAFPLEEMVTSTTTFVRIVEEANESNADKRNWKKLVGTLKASWDASGVTKGALGKGHAVSEKKENPAPIMYLSEQAFPIQSIRTRSVECVFTSRNREDPGHVLCHEAAIEGAEYLEMLAKVLVTTALNLSISEVTAWKDKAKEKVPKKYTGRLSITYRTVIAGLMFLSHVMKAYDEEFSAEVDQLIEDYAVHLEDSSEETLKEKKHSSLDDIIIAVDQMAAENTNDNHGLRAGAHYWKDESSLYLDMRSIFPRYRRYNKGIGHDSPIRSAFQALKLLEGETYYVGQMDHPENEAIKLSVLDLKKLKEHGIQFSYIDHEELEGA